MLVTGVGLTRILGTPQSEPVYSGLQMHPLPVGEEVGSNFAVVVSEVLEAEICGGVEGGWRRPAVKQDWLPILVKYSLVEREGRRRLLEVTDARGGRELGGLERSCWCCL